ncbi:NlpC/P60 family protein [Acuticoccus mangrovi]|uniref:NlpC/P60 family protein n=1 Tax=Acuticoccus mangrovi TaxID=2796142 RepID=UPI002FC869B5
MLAAARRWIGTPYHHQASARGVACDCVGLIRGVWRDLGYAPATPMPAYSRDWGDATGNEGVLAAAGAHLVARPTGTPEPGDVVVLRWRAAGLAKHAGIFAGNTFIHAFEPHGVVEASVDSFVAKRIVAAFAWPTRAPTEGEAA